MWYFWCGVEAAEKYTKKRNFQHFISLFIYDDDRFIHCNIIIALLGHLKKLIFIELLIVFGICNTHQQIDTMEEEGELNKFIINFHADNTNCSHMDAG